MLIKKVANLLLCIYADQQVGLGLLKAKVHVCVCVHIIIIVCVYIQNSIKPLLPITLRLKTQLLFSFV